MHPLPQNGKIDKAEHVMADYWQDEEVDVILFRDDESYAYLLRAKFCKNAK